MMLGFEVTSTVPGLFFSSSQEVLGFSCGLYSASVCGELYAVLGSGCQFLSSASLSLPA
jgi:hypothetical protein